MDKEREFNRSLKKSLSDQFQELNRKCGPPLILELNTEIPDNEHTKSNLRPFISQLRDRATYVHDFAVKYLPILYRTDPRIMIPNVYLLVNGKLIKLHIAVYNLYFHAFEKDKIIYEAREDGKQIIQNSEYTGFGLSYSDFGVKNLNRFVVGFKVLQQAADTFLSYPSNHHNAKKRLARAFATICIMILESIRSSSVEEFVLSQYENEDGVTGMYKKMDYNVHNWGTRCSMYRLLRRSIMKPMRLPHHSMFRESSFQSPIFEDIRSSETVTKDVLRYFRFLIKELSISSQIHDSEPTPAEYYKEVMNKMNEHMEIITRLHVFQKIAAAAAAEAPESRFYCRIY